MAIPNSELPGLEVTKKAQFQLRDEEELSSARLLRSPPDHNELHVLELSRARVHLDSSMCCSYRKLGAQHQL